MVLLAGCDVRLGGQGWSEPDWTGVFYPRGLKPAERLTAYANSFDFVEIDSTFYAAPPSSTVHAWAERTPADFRFTAKVPQQITHDPDPSTGLPRARSWCASGHRPLVGSRPDRARPERMRGHATKGVPEPPPGGKGGSSPWQPRSHLR